MFSDSSLFAGKLHALLCRPFKGERMKGRDLYDFVWYIKNNIPLNLNHLKLRMVQTGHYDQKKTLTLPIIKKLLQEKFSRINYRQAKNDIFPFIKNPFETDIWSEDFFNAVSLQIKSDLLDNDHAH